jgi:hypothetical protein
MKIVRKAIASFVLILALQLVSTVNAQADYTTSFVCNPNTAGV